MDLIKAILSFFSRKSTTTGVDNAPGIFPGVLLDTRSPEEKQQDVTFGELVAKIDAVSWTEKPESSWPVYGSQDQNGQSSCVANAGRKALRVMFHTNNKLDLDFSSFDIYRRRYNYPDPGMGSNDLWKILGEGPTLADLAPSDGKSEAEANAFKAAPFMRSVGDVFKISRGVDLPINADTIASVMQKTGKAIVLFFFFTYDEWARKTPIVIDKALRVGDARALRHAVAAIEFTLLDGSKCIVIDDSAHFGGLDRRVITESFLKARCFYAGYPMNFVFNPSDRPQYAFDRDLAFGDSNEDVLHAQEIMQADACFPSNVQPTGYYGAVTADAVMKFQRKHAVAGEATIVQLAGKRIGPATRKALENA